MHSEGSLPSFITQSECRTQSLRAASRGSQKLDIMWFPIAIAPRVVFNPSPCRVSTCGTDLVFPRRPNRARVSARVVVLLTDHCNDSAPTRCEVLTRPVHTHSLKQSMTRRSPSFLVRVSRARAAPGNQKSHLLSAAVSPPVSLLILVNVQTAACFQSYCVRRECFKMADLCHRYYRQVRGLA